MKQTRYALYKQSDPPTWVVENIKGDGLEKTYHSAIRRAVNSVLRRHPGITKLYIVIEGVKSEPSK